MTRRLRTSIVAALAVLALTTAWRLVVLPARQDAGVALPPADVTVAYHVHTTRSDGTGTVDEVAAAAAAAGVRAVIVTDHGDGTRPPDPPQYRHGVLVVDAVEVGTSSGHYVALEVPRAPFPLGGDPAMVVDDVAALGGFGIAAHPSSPRASLQWSAWDAPIDGLEWLNADSEWRDRPLALWSSLLTYAWRPAETLAALLDRPVAELAAWDRLAATRPVVGLAAHDAHARVGLRGMGEPYDGAVALRVPSYASSFAAFTNVVRLDTPWSGDAGHDAAQLLDAIRRGRVYGVVTGQRSAVPVVFDARAGDATATMGEHLATRPGIPTTLRSDVAAPADARSLFICDGREVASAAGGTLTWATTGDAGACRLEVRIGAASRAPWIVTNPIYLRAALAPPDALVASPAVAQPLVDALAPSSWTPELAPDATGSVASAQPGVLAFRWTLGGAPATYAAWRLDAPPDLATAGGMRMRLSADRPMRVWVQVRTPSEGGRRWGRSMRIGPDTIERAHALAFTSFTPLDGQTGAVPREAITAVLVVVDTVNTERGASGVVRLHEFAVTRE